MFKDFADMIKICKQSKLAENVIKYIPNWNWDSTNGGFQSAPDLQEIAQILRDILIRRDDIF